MGKSTINGHFHPFSIAMLNYQRVSPNLQPESEFFAPQILMLTCSIAIEVAIILPSMKGAPEQRISGAGLYWRSKKPLFIFSGVPIYPDWLVVWNIFVFLMLGMTIFFFQRGWNHQPAERWHIIRFTNEEILSVFLWMTVCSNLDLL